MISCKVAELLFIVHIIMIGASVKLVQKKNFMKSLNKDQKEAYKRISKNRMIVFLFGGLFGSIFAKFYEVESCPQALAILFVQILYYSLYPWPEYMENHLTTEKQKNLWARVNGEMRKRYSSALFIGALSAWL